MISRDETPAARHHCPHRNPQLPPVLSFDWRRAVALTARATTRGYRLVRRNPLPYKWQLLDLTDDEPVYIADTLDDIETWLDT